MVKKRTAGKYYIECTDCNKRSKIFKEIAYMGYFWANNQLGPLKNMARNHLNRMVKTRQRLEALNTPKVSDNELCYQRALHGIRRLNGRYEIYRELYFICKEYIYMIEEYRRVYKNV